MKGQWALRPTKMSSKGLSDDNLARLLAEEISDEEYEDPYTISLVELFGYNLFKKTILKVIYAPGSYAREIAMHVTLRRNIYYLYKCPSTVWQNLFCLKENLLLENQELGDQDALSKPFILRRRNEGTKTVSIPDKGIRTDRIDHWQIFGESQTRCKMLGCKGKTFIYCDKYSGRTHKFVFYQRKYMLL